MQVSPHLQQHLAFYFVLFLVIAILTDVRQYLNVVFSCFSLMIGHVGYLIPIDYSYVAFLLRIFVSVFTMTHSFLSLDCCCLGGFQGDAPNKIISDIFPPFQYLVRV